ncbi:MAG: type I methionyl aminopeptidase [Patulibacter minatonensis]
MSVDTPEELAGLEAVGALVAAVIDALAAAAAPGVSTRELDGIAARMLREAGGRSGPIVTYRYPGVTCLSVDDEIIHAIPGNRRLAAGQLLTVDVALELNGFHADAARTIAVGGHTDPEGERLIVAARAALAAGIAAARPGARLRDIGAAVDRTTQSYGFRVVPELVGHGIGRAMHEPPSVPNWADPDADDVLTPGLVFTIEPMIVAGRPHLRAHRDGWTHSTVDGSRSAHEEHTIMVTADGPAIVLTQPA